MNIEIHSDEKTLKLKENIDKELDILQDRLNYFKSTILYDVILKNSYKINSLKDGFEIDTNIDASLVFLIRQTIRLCISKQSELS